VGAGSTVSFADATVRAGCADLAVAGTLDAGGSTAAGFGNLVVTGTGTLLGGSSTLGLSGTFATPAVSAFTAGTGTVSFVDDCPAPFSAILGDTAFASLSVVTASGREHRFEAGKLQIVDGTLTLSGSAGKLLKVRSTVPGTRAVLKAHPSQSVSYVDAMDNRAVGAEVAPGPASTYHSVDSGNLVRWFAAGEEINSVPALSTWGSIAFALALAAGGFFAVRRLSA